MWKIHSGFIIIILVIKHFCVIFEVELLYCLYVHRWCGPGPMLLVVGLSSVRNLREQRITMKMHFSLCAIMDLGEYLA